MRLASFSIPICTVFSIFCPASPGSLFIGVQDYEPPQP